MVEIIKFGKYEGNSVEQIAIKDYKYLRWIIENVPIKKPSLDERIRYVDFVGNNFISQLNCVIPNCNSPAENMSVYYHQEMDSRSSDKDFIYCSSECFRKDPKVTGEKRKIQFVPINFNSTLSSTKSDTNNLMKLILECMGIKPGRKSKEYLEDFFNHCELKNRFPNKEINELYQF
ncbi:MAG: hypothetical protein WC867_02855 [Candidatus Pacearchaeota archaeon]|jgi:hypothetical protein